MTAFNTVRFRVKPGRHQDFLDAHKNVHEIGRADLSEKVRRGRPGPR